MSHLDLTVRLLQKLAFPLLDHLFHSVPHLPSSGLAVKNLLDPVLLTSLRLDHLRLLLVALASTHLGPDRNRKWPLPKTDVSRWMQIAIRVMLQRGLP